MANPKYIPTQLFGDVATTCYSVILQHYQTITFKILGYRLPRSKLSFCVYRSMPYCATDMPMFYIGLCRPVARGGSGGSYDPPQLPIPKILFHPLAILFHPLAILFHLSAILFHPLAILFHPSAILFHPLAILFHPSAILFHPWNMWMTSHGQCPRGGGGACECPRVGAFFKLMTSRGQCPRGGGGCAWCSTHPSSDPPGWLAGYGPAMPMIYL